MKLASELLHGLWRSLPRDARRRALYGAIDLLAPRAGTLARPPSEPIIVGGALTTASGLGESARLCLSALRALGWDAGHLDVSRLFLRSDLAEPPPGEPARPGQGGTLILHVNGPYMPYVALRLGRPMLSGRRIIGYWAWELPQMGPDWRRGLRHVHEIWVPSRFTAASLPPSNRAPVRIVPHPVSLERRSPDRRAADRARFGLSDEVFCVLTAFDMGSSYARKNPRAAIAAFRTAFGDDPTCRLILKVGHADDAGWAMADLEAAIAGAGNIVLLRETLSSDERTALVAAADVVLSLHRAEGFGLLLAEAMAQAIPAVATGWSGNLDFMSKGDSALIDYRLIPADDPQGTYACSNAHWADADIGQAAAWLARLRDDPAMRRRMGSAARAAVERTLSLDAYRRAIGDGLPPPVHGV